MGEKIRSTVSINKYLSGKENTMVKLYADMNSMSGRTKLYVKIIREWIKKSKDMEKIRKLVNYNPDEEDKEANR